MVLVNKQLYLIVRPFSHETVPCEISLMQTIILWSRVVCINNKRNRLASNTTTVKSDLESNKVLATQICLNKLI